MSFKESRQRQCKSYPKQIRVRATEDEKEQMRGAARGSGLSVSRYVVRSLTEGKITPSVEDAQALRQVRLELHKIGVNLNQLSRTVNTAWLVTDKDIPIPCGEVLIR